MLYEFDKTARYMLRTYRGCTNMETDATYWDDIKDRVSKEDWRWLWSQGVKLGLFRYGHMVQGARLGLEALTKNGHELVFATHRPKQAVNDTVDWLSLYMKGIPYVGLHFLTDGQPKEEAVVEADLLIDDKPQNVVNWYYFRDDGKAILFDRPWNRELEAGFDNGLYIVKGWGEVVNTVDSITRSGKRVRQSR